MDVKLIRHLWGITMPHEEALGKIAQAGLYDGIEARLPPEDQTGQFRDALDRHGFSFIAMAATSGDSIGEHLSSLREQLRGARKLGAKFCNCHSGRDDWSFGLAREYFFEAQKIADDEGIHVCHETHRARVLFNPRDTFNLIEAVPGLRLTCDLSHFVCVCERLLDIKRDHLLELAQRCDHVHARVGYEEGPQVPDPRAPEYAVHLQAHESWWDLFHQTARAGGAREFTITPEFGPVPYLHTLPFSNAPVADLWEICDWQARRQRQRYQML